MTGALTVVVDVAAGEEDGVVIVGIVNVGGDFITGVVRRGLFGPLNVEGNKLCSSVTACLLGVCDVTLVDGVVGVDIVVH